MGTVFKGLGTRTPTPLHTPDHRGYSSRSRPFPTLAIGGRGCRRALVMATDVAAVCTSRRSFAVNGYIIFAANNKRVFGL
jgi:hypothetical protein